MQYDVDVRLYICAYGRVCVCARVRACVRACVFAYGLLQTSHAKNCAALTITKKLDVSFSLDDN